MKTKELPSLPEIRNDLGILDGIWSGWRVYAGELFDPWHSSFRGYRPEELRNIPYLHQIISALERELRQLKTLSQPAQEAPERKSRQLSNLARPAQSMNPDRRSGRERRLSWRGTAPVSVQIGPGIVRANPARHKRSL